MISLRYYEKKDCVLTLIAQIYLIPIRNLLICSWFRYGFDLFAYIRYSACQFFLMKTISLIAVHYYNIKG